MKIHQLLQILGKKGRLTTSQALEALHIEQKTGMPIENILLDLGVEINDIIAAKNELSEFEKVGSVYTSDNSIHDSHTDFTEELWNHVCQYQESYIDFVPIWAIDILKSSFEELIQLPHFDDVGILKGKTWIGLLRPSIEKVKYDQSYIDFLQQQISLNARGEQWTNILKSRLSALSPFVNKEVTHMTLHFKKDCFSLWILAEQPVIVYFENL